MARGRGCGRRPDVTHEETLTAHNKTVNCVRFSPGGDMIASGGDTGEVIVWRPGATSTNQHGDRTTWRTSAVLRGHSDDVQDLAWAPGARRSSPAPSTTSVSCGTFPRRRARSPSTATPTTSRASPGTLTASTSPPRAATARCGSSPPADGRRAPVPQRALVQARVVPEDPQVRGLGAGPESAACAFRGRAAPGDKNP